MRDVDGTELNPSDLPIALYLNQRLVFDILAAYEDGFSRFTNIQTTSAGSSSSESSGGVELGLGNVFALFGIGGRVGSRSAQAQGETATEEIVYTPASLFARLRHDLRTDGLVREITGGADLESVQPGDFVEFVATLRKSALEEVMATFSELIPFFAGSEEQPEQPSGRRQRQRRRAEPDPKQDPNEQFVKLSRVLTASRSRDLLAEVRELNIVLTTEQDWFIDPTMNDIIDGRFRVFGKATRVIAAGEGKINLLRKTAFGKFPQVVAGLGEALSNIEGMSLPEAPETEIQGPAMQVIPVAMFT